MGLREKFRQPRIREFQIYKGKGTFVILQNGREDQIWTVWEIATWLNKEFPFLAYFHPTDESEGRYDNAMGTGYFSVIYDLSTLDSLKEDKPHLFLDYRWTSDTYG